MYKFYYKIAKVMKTVLSGTSPQPLSPHVFLFATYVISSRVVTIFRGKQVRLK